jgi:hypothetical protein
MDDEMHALPSLRRLSNGTLSIPIEIGNPTPEYVRLSP